MHVQDLALSCTPSHGGIGSINKYNTAHSNLASVCLVMKLVHIVVPMIGFLLDGVCCTLHIIQIKFLHGVVIVRR